LLIDGSTTGSKTIYVPGDQTSTCTAAGGVNALVCNTIFLGFDQFSFWKVARGLTGRLSGRPGREATASGCALPGSPVIGSGKNVTSKCAAQPTPGPGALCFNVEGTPGPAIGPGNAGAN
jgi:hypothetical protein